MQMIDNQEGINMNAAGESKAEKYVKMNTVHIYGRTEGTDDKCVDRVGMQLASFVRGGKDLHPLSSSALPIGKIKTIAIWYG